MHFMTVSKSLAVPLLAAILLSTAACSVSAGPGYVNAEPPPAELDGLPLNSSETSAVKEDFIQSNPPPGRSRIGAYGEQGRLLVVLTEGESSLERLRQELVAGQAGPQDSLRPVDGGLCLDVVQESTIVGSQCASSDDGYTVDVSYSEQSQEHTAGVAKQVLRDWA